MPAAGTFQADARLVRFLQALLYRGQEPAGEDHADLPDRQPVISEVVPFAGGVVNPDDRGKEHR